MYTRVKTEQEIKDMRVSGQMLAQVLTLLKPQTVPGISTMELNDIAAKELKAFGGKPAFLGYQGFPSVICISLNDEVVHGMPKQNRIVQAKDIVSLDFGVSYNGMITDSAMSVIAEPDNASQQLIDLLKYTERSMLEGIAAVKDGCYTGDIAAAVQKVLEKHNYGIVRDLVGHGVGHAVHEDPNIPNYGKRKTGPQLVRGMTIAIEPMATLGSEKVQIDPDGWTVRTQDGSLSAHFEHTVLITDDGFEILTQRND